MFEEIYAISFTINVKKQTEVVVDASLFVCFVSEIFVYFFRNEKYIVIYQKTASLEVLLAEIGPPRAVVLYRRILVDFYVIHLNQNLVVFLLRLPRILFVFPKVVRAFLLIILKGYQRVKTVLGDAHSPSLKYVVHLIAARKENINLNKVTNKKC